MLGVWYEVLYKRICSKVIQETRSQAHANMETYVGMSMKETLESVKGKQFIFRKTLFLELR